jgi:hypothetical protein
LLPGRTEKRGRDPQDGWLRLLSTATDKLTPHITGAGLKDRLTAAVNDIKTIAGVRSHDLLNLEDRIDALQIIIEEARKALQNMN